MARPVNFNVEIHLRTDDDGNETWFVQLRSGHHYTKRIIQASTLDEALDVARRLAERRDGTLASDE